MQTFTGENIISVERKYIDVPLSTITASAMHAPVLSSRQSQPVQEMGTRLLELAKAGDAEGVRDLMNRGAPFSTDWLGTSPLHFAAQYNHLETVEMLLKAGISRDARNKVERTPLHVAAQEGNTDIVKLLISYGADVDSKDMLKMTPLHWAAENGQADCVRILLDFGADPLVLNKFDKTPQNIAHDNNRLDIVEMLQDAASLDPVSRKVLRAQGLEAAIENNVQIQNNLQQTNNNINQPAVTHYEEVQTSSGAVIKIHKIVGRRKVNVPKQHQLQNSNVNLDYSQINETLSSDDLATTNLVNSLTSQGQQNQSSLQNTNSTLQMLQEHGITMLPVDDSSIVASAVQSGQTVVLTEAGKMALNLTKLNQPTQQTNNLFKKLPVTSKQVKTPQKILIDGRKLIRVQPEELINMTREKKVIIHTGDKKMGRPGQIIFSKPIRQVTNIGKLTDIQNKKVISSEITNKLKTDSQTSEVPRVKDLEEITKQLEEARRQAEMYKEKLLLKEKEAEQYKLQLESLVNGK